MRPWSACAVRPVRKGGCLGLLLSLAALVGAGPAAASVAGVVAIVSDDRFRGRSVSEGRPAASLDLSYDAQNGAYVGLAATGVASRHDGPQLLSVQASAGYVARLPAGPSLDLGVIHSNYSEYYGGQARAAYSELYAGLITRRFTTRLYYSPDYFERDNSTLYGEVNTAVRPFRGWRLSAHAGLLTLLSGPRPEAGSVQYDWRVGLATALKAFEIELSCSGAGPGPDDYAGAAHGGSGVALALRRAF